jgi:hypothetical protein
MRRLFRTVLGIAAVALSSEGQAQVLTPSRARLDSLPRPPAPPPLPASGVRICLDCHGWTIRPEQEPAYIIKDATARVIAMVPPGDTSYQEPGHRVRLLEPEMIASIDVVRDSALVPVLGRGFENGLIIITLTPAGTAAWRRAAPATKTPPGLLAPSRVPA